MDTTPGDAPLNMLLRFAITAFFFLILSCVQLIYRQLIHHRFIEHRPSQFIDFMTMANIRSASLMLPRRQAQRY